MKKLIISLLIVMMFPFAAQAAQISQAYDPSELFTGDKKLACEALLCLSSPHRPAECRPAIRRLYSIKKYKHGSFSFSRTIKARKDFLKLCPSDGDTNIDHLASMISKTMNQCDADSLNQRKIYHARAYNALRGEWSQWRLLGRNNDDHDSKKTDNPNTNTKYNFTLRNFPVCTQRQLDYKANMAAGRDGPERVWDHENREWKVIHPIPLTCYETRAEIDPTAPQDCQDLFNSNYSHYTDLKYENGMWVNN